VTKPWNWWKLAAALAEDDGRGILARLIPAGLIRARLISARLIPARLIPASGAKTNKE
jgi:hypothetical protein